MRLPFDKGFPILIRHSADYKPPAAKLLKRLLGILPKLTNYMHCFTCFRK
jgi:hypothetical protein